MRDGAVAPAAPHDAVDFICLLLRKLLQQLLQHLQMKRGGRYHLHRCQSKRDGERTVEQHART